MAIILVSLALCDEETTLEGLSPTAAEGPPTKAKALPLWRRASAARTKQVMETCFMLPKIAGVTTAAAAAAASASSARVGDR
jgi:hypothetical protein